MNYKPLSNRIKVAQKSDEFLALKLIELQIASWFVNDKIILPTQKVAQQIIDQINQDLILSGFSIELLSDAPFAFQVKQGGRRTFHCIVHGKISKMPNPIKGKRKSSLYALHFDWEFIGLKIAA